MMSKLIQSHSTLLIEIDVLQKRPLVKPTIFQRNTPVLQLLLEMLHFFLIQLLVAIHIKLIEDKNDFFIEPSFQMYPLWFSFQGDAYELLLRLSATYAALHTTHGAK